MSCGKKKYLMPGEDGYEERFMEVALEVKKGAISKGLIMSNGISAYDPAFPIHNQDYLLYDFLMKKLLQK